MFPDTCTLTNEEHVELFKNMHTEGSKTFFVYLPFYVFYVIGHQPAELRKVSGGGRGVLQDRDI